MSLHRRAPKRDTAEPGVVSALEAVGATVVRLSVRDVPDLLVGFRGADCLLEVKSGKKKLAPGQVIWHATWRGRKPVVVRSALEALAAIGALAP